MHCSFLENGLARVSEELIGHAIETVIDLIGLVISAEGEAAELSGMHGLRAARLQAILVKMRGNLSIL